MYITLSPSEIRYTQDSIASCFQNGNDIEDLILDIINGQTTPDKIRTIRVFFKDGKYYSEDNRRLYVLKTVQELSEPYLMVTVKLTSYFDFEENKFTTTNDGLRIRVRRNRNDAKKPRNVKRPLSEYFPSLTSGGPTKTTYASPRTTPVKAAKTKITYEDFPSLTSGGPTKTTYASPRTTPVKAAKTECKRSAGTTDKTLICHSDILPSSWSLTTDDASSATNVPPSICITPRPSATNVPPSICITPRPSATNVPPSICIKSKPSRLEKLSCCVIL
ncbi:uncharacterized protein LOC118763415 isoform X1 [Octopus sinensis]|uniref:Uncharacterized protein LOC118763415 isoform X1 n=1 Tax=Octopus sinensis TaxID=2607531 RepID=A0A7E6ETA8_9MOLL|nr:uncharacterized protein LOC118763415 isoform X1 [Octopus sinensis]